MQILPSTGEWIAEKLGVKDYRDDSLYDPELNIWFGVYYLSYLYGRFSSDTWVFAAYNAGEGNVSEWISAGLEAEDIPFSETRSYVKKVRRAAQRYRNKKMLSFY